MKVAVLGAGIIGITTAYELALAGHTVTVFDQRATPAEEASFALAGLCSPGYVNQWAWGSLPAQWRRDVWSAHSPLIRSRGHSLRERLWLWQWLRASKNPDDAAQRAALTQLAQLSSQRMAEVAHDMAWEHEQTEGLSVLLRTEQELALAQERQAALAAVGIASSVLDAEATRHLEPALNPDTSVVGCLHLPGEKTANCRQITLLLKKACDTLGVDFQFEHTVAPLKPGNATTLHVQQGQGLSTTQVFDAVVVCAGENSTALLQHLHPGLPCIPVHGYSVSAQIREPLNAPRHSWMDWQHSVHITRLGQRVRVSGLAQVGGGAAGKNAAALKTLYKVLLDWFPGAAHMQNTQEWRGTRLCTTDSLPIVGQSSAKGVWLNIAHGDTGWANSWGAAQGLTAMMQGQSLAGVDWARLGVARLA